MPRIKEVSDRRVRKWVDERITERIAERVGRNQMILGFRKQRFMRLKARPPAAYQEYIGQEGVKVPLSFRLVETVIGSVAAERPRFEISSPDRALAQRASQWCSMVLQNQETISDPALYWKYWDGLVADGMVAMKTQRIAWTEYPRIDEGESDAAYNKRVDEFIKQRPPVPWRTRVIDGMTFIPPHYEFGNDFAIETGLRSTEDTLTKLGLRTNEKGRVTVVPVKDEPIPTFMQGLRLGPRIQVDELWTPDTLFVRIHGKIFEYENDLGRLPYVWTSGATLPFADPQLEALSVLFPLTHLEPWVNQFLTTLVAQGTAAATATPVIKQAPSGTTGAQGDTQIGEFQPGKLHTLPPGAEMGFVAPPLPAESITLLDTMMQIAERFTLSPTPAFAGTRTPGVVLSAVAERTLAVLKPRVDQAKKTWADQMKFWFQLVKDIKSPVAVSGMTFIEKGGRSRMAEVVLTPSDIKKISDVTVEIKFQTVQDKIAWDTHNVMMAQSQLWSMERARRESGVVDPESEADDIFLEQLERSPVIQLYLQKQATSGVAPLEALQTLIEQATADGGPGIPGEGPPEEGLGVEGRIPGSTRAPGGTGNQTAPTQ